MILLSRRILIVCSFSQDYKVYTTRKAFLLNYRSRSQIILPVNRSRPITAIFQNRPIRFLRNPYLFQTTLGPPYYYYPLRYRFNVPIGILDSRSRYSLPLYKSSTYFSGRIPYNSIRLALASQVRRILIPQAYQSAGAARERLLQLRAIAR